jgi:hypothetical protein
VYEPGDIEYSKKRKLPRALQIKPVAGLNLLIFLYSDDFRSMHSPSGSSAVLNDTVVSIVCGHGLPHNSTDSQCFGKLLYSFITMSHFV